MKSLFILFFLLCGFGAHAHGVDSTFAVPAPQTLYAPLTAESLNSLHWGFASVSEQVEASPDACGWCFRCVPQPRLSRHKSAP